MDSDDKEAIEQKTQAVAEASGKLAEQIYKQAAEEQQAQQGEAGEQKEGSDEAVDAEFEEVKDKENKQ